MLGTRDVFESMLDSIIILDIGVIIIDIFVLAFDSDVALGVIITDSSIVLVTEVTINVFILMIVVLDTGMVINVLLDPNTALDVEVGIAI